MSSLFVSPQCSLQQVIPIDESLNDVELEEIEVEQGEGITAIAGKVEALISSGIASCLGILVKGLDRNNQERLGLFHYQAGDQESFDRFLEKGSWNATEFQSAVIGGYQSPALDPGLGSEEDLEEIEAVFKKRQLPISKILFNPTNTPADIEKVGNRFIDVKIDGKGNFSYLDLSKQKGKKRNGYQSLFNSISIIQEIESDSLEE